MATNDRSKCTHCDAIKEVTPSAKGCEECHKAATGGFIYVYAVPAAMSAVATIHRTATPPRTSIRQNTRSSKTTIRRRAGVGAMSTRLLSNWITRPSRWGRSRGGSEQPLSIRTTCLVTTSAEILSQDSTTIETRPGPFSRDAAIRSSSMVI